MKLAAGFMLLVLVSGCCFLQNKGGTTTTLEATTTTMATTVEATTTEPSVVQTTTTTTTTTQTVTSTTLLSVEGLPDYKEGDFLTFSIVRSEAGGKFYESSMQVAYEGKSDNQLQDVFEEKYSGQKAGLGISPAMLTSTVRHYYLIENGKFILDKSVAYPRASTAGYTSYSYTPGKVVLDFPLDVGKRWNGSTVVAARRLNQLVSKLTVDYETSVVGLREFALPNGTFQCVELAHKEDEYFSAQLIQTTTSTLYYCPGVKYYAFWTADVVLASGKKSDKVRIPQYFTVLDIEEEHENGTLVDYKIST